MKFKYNNIEYELIMFGVIGSRLYGTDDEYSDWDYAGIFVSPIETKIGLLNNINMITDSKSICNIINENLNLSIDSDDVNLYEIKKFIKLSADNNPNILDILFIDDDYVLYKNEKWDKITEQRDMFLSKKIKYSFSGYAYSQLKRINGHYNKIEKHPKINELYNFLKEGTENGELERISVSYFFGDRVSNHFEYAKKYIETDQSYARITKFLVDNDIEDYSIPKKGLRTAEEFIKDLREFKNLWEWKLNRNKKRAKQEERIGYDAKHALHLIRLMNSAKEILETEDYNPRLRDDSLKYIINIKNGNISYDELIERYEELKNELDELYEISKLRHSPDIKVINDLLIELSF